MNKPTTSINIPDMKAALASLERPTCKIQEAFNALYPEIKASLERGVTNRAICKKLTELGLTIHPSKFKKSLNMAEAHYKSISEQTIATKSNTGAPNA